ncbi:MAG: hypothetical protein CVV21_05450 [Candidatus Goldiibacteriota bacterium HGW-Goldbacteria-1]|jgi:hypothetical protein|nr:MAG: hypothetical protein CVV21_05450 [Candidatus Goldiibacteriota bacterium HGW-Goldbacteria-1]
MSDIKIFKQLEKADSKTRRTILNNADAKLIADVIENTKEACAKIGYYSMPEVAKFPRIPLASTRELQLQRFICESGQLNGIDIVCREFPVGKKSGAGHIDLIGKNGNDIYLYELKYASKDDLTKAICQIAGYYCYMVSNADNIFPAKTFNFKPVIVADAVYYEESQRKNSSNGDYNLASKLLSLLKANGVDINLCEIKYSMESVSV